MFIDGSLPPDVRTLLPLGRGELDFFVDRDFLALKLGTFIGKYLSCT